MFEWLKRLFMRKKTTTCVWIDEDCPPDCQSTSLADCLAIRQMWRTTPVTVSDDEQMRIAEANLFRESRNRLIADKNQQRQKDTLGYGLKSRDFKPRPAYEKKLYKLDKKAKECEKENS